MVHSEINDPGAKPTTANELKELSTLTEPDKWELVNSANSWHRFLAAIHAIGVSNHNDPDYDAIRFEKIATSIYNNGTPYSNLTRAYGLRQQLMYIMYNEGRIHLL